MNAEPKRRAHSVLTSAEHAEFEKLIEDPAIIGHALYQRDGEELALDGLWEDTVPVLSNILDLAETIGTALGGGEGAAVMIAENAQFELSSVALSSVHAVLLKKKSSRKVGGLHSVL